MRNVTAPAYIAEEGWRRYNSKSTGRTEMTAEEDGRSTRKRGRSGGGGHNTAGTVRSAGPFCCAHRSSPLLPRPHGPSLHPCRSVATPPQVRLGPDDVLPAASGDGDLRDRRRKREYLLLPEEDDLGCLRCAMGGEGGYHNGCNK